MFFLPLHKLFDGSPPGLPSKFKGGAEMAEQRRNSRERIVEAARTEFARCGFKEASMRNIASLAGVSASALYKHFPSKEDMFSSLVEPVKAEFERIYREREQREHERVKHGDRMFSEQTGGCRWAMEFIYDHVEEFRLLVNCADGTIYGNFVHDVAELEENATFRFITELRKKGEDAVMLPRGELHLLVTTQVEAIFEALKHGFSKEDALHYADTLDCFFTPGWMNVMRGFGEQK